MGGRELLETVMEGGLFLCHTAVWWRMGDIWTREDSRGGRGNRRGFTQWWHKGESRGVQLQWVVQFGWRTTPAPLLPAIFPPSTAKNLALYGAHVAPEYWCLYECQEVDPDPLSHGFRHRPTRMPELRRMKAWVEPTTHRLWRAYVSHTAISI